MIKLVNEKKYTKIFKEVLRHIKPSPEERKKLEGLTKKTLEIAKEEMKEYGGDAILAGSVTRDTWLPGKKEFDVFLLFPTSLKEEELENFGLSVGKKIIRKLKGKYKIEYAQHPYVSGRVRGVSIDIVPCYRVASAEKIKSAVDRTPFHVKYLKEKLPIALADDVRLLKRFLTVNGIYGADAKTQGFSGYVCELLVVNYGRFLDVLRSIVEWEPGEIIDIEGYYKKSEYKKLRKKFKGQPLILIDPTDRNRNAAAAVSAESFFLFKSLAKKFLEKPSGEFFFPREIKPLTENELIQLLLKRRTELLIVKFKPPKVVPDILWPQLRRFADRLESILEEVRYEFKVLRKDVYTNEKDLAIVLLEMEISKLPLIQKRVGPSIFNLENSKRFLEKYEKEALVGPYVENNFWCVEVRRKFVTARKKLIDSLKKPVKILEAKGIPNFIAKEIAKKFEIFSETDKIMELIKKDENFGIFLRKYFEKRLK